MFAKIPFINDILKPLFKADVFAKEVDRFNFQRYFRKSNFQSF